MNIPDNQFYTMILLTAGMSILFGVMLVYAARELLRSGKTRVFFLDPDSKDFTEAWVKIIGHEFKKNFGKTEKTFKVEGEGSLGLKKRTWIINPVTGWIYVPQTGKQILEEGTEGADGKPFTPGLLHRLMISNPATYHLAIARNRAADALNANQKPDQSWIGIAIICGLFAFIIIVGMLGFAIWKISNLASHAATGG